jgi:hypothetical protein
MVFHDYIPSHYLYKKNEQHRIFGTVILMCENDFWVLLFHVNYIFCSAKIWHLLKQHNLPKSTIVTKSIILIINYLIFINETVLKTYPLHINLIGTQNGNLTIISLLDGPLCSEYYKTHFSLFLNKMFINESELEQWANICYPIQWFLLKQNMNLLVKRVYR